MWQEFSGENRAGSKDPLDVPSSRVWVGKVGGSVGKVGVSLATLDDRRGAKPPNTS